MAQPHRYRVNVGGVDHELELEFTTADRKAATARVGDTTLDLVATDRGGWMVRPSGEPSQTTVWLDDPQRPTSVTAKGYTADVEVQTARAAALADALAAAGGAGSGSAAIKAPMPGRVVSVLVGVGDPVQPDQPVIIVEAMKMENEVAATAEGRVAAIRVEAGATVDAGEVLVELEPHPAS